MKISPLTAITMAFVVTLLTTEAIFHWSLREPQLTLPVATHRGVVDDTPRLHGKVWSAPVRLCCQEHKHPSASVQLTAMQKTEGEAPLAGSIIALHAPIEAPINTHNPGEMDYGTYLRRHGIRGTAFCHTDRWTELGGYSQALRLRLLRLRSRIIHRYGQHIEGSSLALLSAITLGDRSRLSSEERQTFSAAGASHLIALSGLHLSILAMLAGILAHMLTQRISSPQHRRILRPILTLTGITLVWGYVLLAGMPLSLVRAATMLTMGLLLSAMERSPLSLHTLALAALIMLTVWPSSILDVGFQLSFAALAGITVGVNLCHPPHSWGELHTQYGYIKGISRVRAERMGRAVWNFFLVSISAQLATLPLVVYYFHFIPTYGLVLNIVAIPLTYGILLLAIFLLPLLALPGAFAALGAWLSCTVSWLLELLLAASQCVAQWPGSTIEVNLEQRPDLTILHSRQSPRLMWKDGTTWDFATTTPQLPHTPATGQARRTEAGCLISSAVGRIAMIDQRPPQGRPHTPLPVDILWLTRNARGTLQEWTHIYAPKEVVLDATLSPYMLSKFSHEAKALSLPLYPISTEGARRIELANK